MRNVLKGCHMSGEDTTTYGQQWDISVFGPGVTWGDTGNTGNDNGNSPNNSGDKK